MADLIDRDKLRDALYDADAITFRGLEILNTFPTVNAEPVKHGEWEPSPHLFGYVRCSECHDCNIWSEWIDGKKWNFCPNCGADMRGET